MRLFLSDGLNFVHNFKFSIDKNLNFQRRGYTPFLLSLFKRIDRATREYAYYILSLVYKTDQVISPFLPFLYQDVQRKLLLLELHAV